MASERTLERAVRAHCPGEALKLTCPSQPGVADRLILLPDGRVRWLELKVLKRWPVRGRFRPGITAQQAVFLYNWEQKGGVAWLLVQVARDYLLFDPSAARRLVQGVKLGEVKDLASYQWYGSTPWDQLWRVL